ncbi:Pyridine nucleotide-disulphide oxidoreductase [Haladaptatus litoreus]|uniref:Pyridine nucleotide-disulphide oxidoreductase n=1 Tax=Haladaptatus litoreus TaxID=553468 RepID=A0A1N6X8X9_9EURY|nr:FAD-dependent oxidoreductase [Haladaptatus litoreus]SIQ98737.1 Pyridine nucleotide-disulphide oxidoreductase [Haladaptatus litoreus]
MTNVVIIGGGPAGLSAALFTAKNGLDTVVFDTDETAMHAAHLWNYLGIKSIGGSEYMEIAREQVDEQGAERKQGEEVTSVEKSDDGFTITAESDESDDAKEYDAKYVVFTTGRARDMAEKLGCELNDDGTVAIDMDNATTVENAYAAGWTARADKIQAAISVGGGAAAGLDILSAEKGRAFHDFDTPEDA